MDLSLTKKELILAGYDASLGQRGRADRTRDSYRKIVERFFGWLEKEGITELGQADKTLMTRYREYLFHRTNPCLSLKTQSMHLVCLRGFFRYLEKSNQLLSNPTMHWELPKVPDSLPRVILSEPQIKKLLAVPELDTALGLRDRAIMELLYASGIRNTELRNLRLYDLDFESGTIRIEHGKGDKTRVVPMGSIAGHYLREYLNAARPKLFTKGRKHLPRAQNDVVFVSFFGRKISAGSLVHLIQKYLEAAGIKERIGAHTFRHSCATHLLRHGAPLRVLQELLGHTSLDTTQKYLRVEIIDLKKVHAKTHPREQC